MCDKLVPGKSQNEFSICSYMLYSRKHCSYSINAACFVSATIMVSMKSPRNLATTSMILQPNITAYCCWTLSNKEYC